MQRPVITRHGIAVPLAVPGHHRLHIVLKTGICGSLLMGAKIINAIQVK
jgi:hypothetical protein